MCINHKKKRMLKIGEPYVPCVALPCFFFHMNGGRDYKSA